ncbi:MAG TPA: hypothetical protein VMU45_09975 [Candidatus Eisenbacteria bacterium]|nr:hypothetical protein [Candidatus Eisenbacteria bacterium]
MSTVVDPETKDQKSPSTAPAVQGPELFAAEIEMEKKSSNLGPLIMVLALVAVVGGTIFYFFKTAREVLTEPVATSAVNEILKSQGPGRIHFSVGTVVSSVDDKPNDPHYKMLAKAGILVVKPRTWNSIITTMTPAGEKVLGDIQGVEKGKNADGNVTYSVPLAERKIVKIDKITMIKPHLARVDYTWQWAPNRLGHEFDAAGDLVHTFNTWDRATLIKNYGVDFYSAGPTKASVVLAETKDGVWKPYVE